MFRRSPGFFVAASGVRTDVTAPALAEINTELTKIRSGINADELTLTKDAIIRSLPSDFETSSSVSNSTAGLFIYGLPLDHDVRAQARFAGVTSAQVTAAAQKYLVPDRTLFIVVGDRAKIAADLEKLNLGTIEEWSADGTRVGR